MTNVNARIAAFTLVAGAVAFATPSLAAACGKGSFGSFLAEYKKEAAAKGISKRGLAALDGLKLDEKVLAADKRQGVFKQSFEQFSGRMISSSRVSKGRDLMSKHAPTLKKIEQQYGVPGPVVIAIWGLETDYGTNQGKMSVVRSVATLAYDCRRTGMFQNELTEALRIIERGDLSMDEMRGDWAGEIGQTQFLPSSYMKYAVDFDGNGKRDLVRSVPDVLGSTANYLKSYGWQRGQAWGPGQPNFDIIKQWNKADVYARTIAAFAEKLDGGKSAKAADKAIDKLKDAKGKPDKRARR